MPRLSPPLAQRADPFDLYQRTVQLPECPVTLADQVYLRARSRRARNLREDFCGTGAVACEWATRRTTNSAIGLDIDPAALAWGAANTIAALPLRARSRVRLLNRDVLRAGRGLGRPDIIVALNYSWALFTDRSTLLHYFTSIRRSLAPGGMLMLHVFTGPATMTPLREESRRAGVLYVWEQIAFDAVTSIMDCAIHYRFRDGSWLRNAFTYRWRVWGLRETRELLAQAGLTDSAVFWPYIDARKRLVHRAVESAPVRGGASVYLFAGR